MVPVRGTKAARALAGHYSPGGAPAGAKAVFLPRAVAGKRVGRGPGGRPTLEGKTSRSTLYFLDFITADFESELEALQEDHADPQDLLAAIRAHVDPWVAGLGDHAVYTVMLATGDYGKGSEIEKSKLGRFLSELILRFIQSKAVHELADFIIAIAGNDPK